MAELPGSCTEILFIPRVFQERRPIINLQSSKLVVFSIGKTLGMATLPPSQQMNDTKWIKMSEYYFRENAELQ